MSEVSRGPRQETRPSGRDSARPTSRGVWFIYWVLGPLAVSYAILGRAPEADAYNVILASVVTLLAACRLLTVIVSARIRPIESLYWLFALVSTGIAALAQTSLHVYPYMPDARYAGPSLLLILVGHIAFMIGVEKELARRRWLKQRNSGKIGSSGESQWALSEGRIVLIAGVALVQSWLYISVSGGPAIFFRSRAEFQESFYASSSGTSESQAISGLVNAAGTVTALVALLGMILMGKVARSRSWYRRLLWIAIIVTNIIVNNPISNSRYWALTVMFSIVLVMLRHRPTRFAQIVTAGTLAALIVFPYSDYFRYAAPYRRPLESGSLFETLATKDYDQVAMVGNGLGWISENGLTWGHQTMTWLLFWVPRSVWPDKSVDTGVMVGEWMGVSNTNLSSPIWIELYIDFGLVGLALGMYAFGVLAARLDQEYDVRVTREGTVSAVTICVPIVAGYTLILCRGPMLQAVGRIAVLLVILAMATSVASRSREEALPGNGRQLGPRTTFCLSLAAVLVVSALLATASGVLSFQD